MTMKVSHLHSALRLEPPPQRRLIAPPFACRIGFHAWTYGAPHEAPWPFVYKQQDKECAHCHRVKTVSCG